MYLELAHEVNTWNAEFNNTNNKVEERNSRELPASYLLSTMRRFRIAASQYSGVGYLIGTLLLLRQISVSVQFLKNDQGLVGPCLFGMLDELLFIIPRVALV